MMDATGHHAAAIAAGDCRLRMSNAIESSAIERPDPLHNEEFDAAAGGESHLPLTVSTGGHEATVAGRFDSCLSRIEPRGSVTGGENEHVFA
jgi:hypothetical protein